MNNYLRNFVSHLDIVVDDGIALAGTRRTQHDAGPKGVDDIDPAGVPPFPVVEERGKIDRVFVLDQPRFLHETFVLVVEGIVRHTAREQPPEPDTRCEQADVAGTEGYGIEEARGGGSEAQVKQEVAPEK